MDLLVYQSAEALESEAGDSETNCFPGLGIVTTVISTLLAITVIPNDPEPKGALFFPALILVAGLWIAPLTAAIRNPKALLRTEHVIVLAPTYWLLLDLLQGAYSLDGVQRDHVITAFIAIGLFVAAVWVGASGRAWNIPRSMKSASLREFSSNTFFGLSVAAFILGMLPFAIPVNFNLIEMIYYVGQNRWAAPWARGQLGGWDAFLDQLQYFGYLVPMLTVIIANRTGWMKRRSLLCTAMSVIVIIFVMQSGNRRIIGVMFGMAFITWILTQAQLRAKHVLITAVTSAALLFALEIMLDYRNVGLAALTEQQEDKPSVGSTHIRVDDNFYRLSQIIELIPEQFPYVYQKYIFWVAIRPIPRVLWPEKPIDPGFDLPSAIGAKGVSLSASVIGELYMSGGFIAIFLGGVFYGKLSGMVSQLLTQRATIASLIIYGIMTMSLFAGVRSMLELVLMNYVTVAWVGLSHAVTYLEASNST